MRNEGEDVTNGALRVERIKERIDRAEYRVDVDAVADAIVRRLLFIPPGTRAGTPAGPARGHPA
jgi:hypothetical protein